MKTIVQYLTLGAFLAVAIGALAEESPWNQFRGPRGTGVHPTANPPVEFGPGVNELWRTPIHGLAWSSPVVLEGRLWMTTATPDGKQLSVIAVDQASGQVVYDRVVFEVAEPRFRHETNSYASCTPCVEAGRVYVHFGSYGTACLDAESGESLWERRDFVCDDFRGPGSSPVLCGDRLVIQFDGVDFQFVAILDKETGETVLRIDRDIDYGTDDGDYKKTYGTPSVIQVGDQQQLVAIAAVEAVAYQWPTGEPLWRVHQGGMNSAAPPLFDGERVYLTGGRGPTSLVAVRPDGQGDVTATHLAWSNGKSVPQRSSPLLVEGMLFTISDDGIAMCRDSSTGAVHWRKRLGGTFWSSPVSAAGRIYAFNKGGVGYVYEAANEYRELARVELDEVVNATPAIVGNSLVVRTETMLWRFGE